jgi:predicted ATP-binding protein involved in virulence
MKIKRVFIDGFKNLNDFEVQFKENSSLNLIIGNNGSGKTNFFEAICSAFNEVADPTEKVDYKYEIEYERSDEDIFLSNTDKKHSIKKNEVDAKLPNNIFLYYSGNYDRFEKLFKGKKFKKYTDDIRKQSEIRLRRMFYIEDIHCKLAFLACSAYNSPTMKVFKETIGIDSIKSLTINFKEPSWAKKKKTDHPFWEPEGSITTFIDRLEKAGELKLDNGKASQLIINNITDISDNTERSKELFAKFDALYFFEMVKSIEIEILKDGKLISFDGLSEGEKQLILILGLIDCTNESETLFLLDEPDTFLHPKWQRELIENIKRMNFNGQLILTTHSPLSVGEVEKENIVIFKEGDCYYPNSDTLNRDVSQILDEVMDVRARPVDVHDLIMKFDKNISLRNLVEAKKIFEELKIVLSESDPYFLKANILLERLEKRA